MIEFFESLDQLIALAINGWPAEWLDQPMMLISDKTTWLPLYLGILFYLNKTHEWQTAMVAIAAVFLCILATDQSSVFLKEMFGRYRPCHHATLKEQLRLMDGCGGLFSFVSSHACNTMGVAVFFSLLFKHRIWSIVLVVWALLNAYSRLYLGKHYLSDVVMGALLGAAIGWAFYRIYGFVLQKMKLNT